MKKNMLKILCVLLLLYGYTEARTFKRIRDTVHNKALDVVDGVVKLATIDHTRATQLWDLTPTFDNISPGCDLDYFLRNMKGDFLTWDHNDLSGGTASVKITSDVNDLGNCESAWAHSNGYPIYIFSRYQRQGTDYSLYVDGNFNVRLTSTWNTVWWIDEVADPVYFYIKYKQSSNNMVLDACDDLSNTACHGYYAFLHDKHNVTNQDNQKWYLDGDQKDKIKNKAFYPDMVLTFHYGEWQQDPDPYLGYGLVSLSTEIYPPAEHQQWTLVPDGVQSHFENGYGQNLMLDLAWGTTQNGQEVGCHSPHAGPEQDWEIILTT